jgi:dephospho-CoA kinase
MLSKEQKIEKLEEFIKRDKFSEEAWNQRGLLPSSDEMSQELNAFFNATAQKLKKILKKIAHLKHSKRPLIHS